MAKEKTYELWLYSDLLKSWVNSPEHRSTTDTPNHILYWQFEQMFPNRVWRLDIDGKTDWLSNSFFDSDFYIAYAWDGTSYIDTLGLDPYNPKASVDNAINHFRQLIPDRSFMITKGVHKIHIQETRQQLTLF